MESTLIKFCASHSTAGSALRPVDVKASSSTTKSVRGIARIVSRGSRMMTADDDDDGDDGDDGDDDDDGR